MSGSPWSGFFDDAAIFPPGNADLMDAVTAYAQRDAEWFRGLVASLVVRDTDIASVPPDIALSVVVTGGAGAVEGALKLANRRGQRLAGVEVALRDLDDLPGNTRRVIAALDAARDQGLVPEGDTAPQFFVEIPGAASDYAWQAAADVVASAELRLKFRTGGLDAALFPSPSVLAGWIDAALDRETPFKCTAGLHNAIRHPDPEDRWWHHGFLNLLLATAAAWDGATREEIAAVLAQTEPATLSGQPAQTLAQVAAARRWFTSVGTCSIREPLDDLLALELLGEPR